MKSAGKIQNIQGMNTKAIALIFCASVSAAFLNAQAQEPTFQSETDRLSYAVGMNFANMLKAQQMPVDADWVCRGIRESMENNGVRLSENEALGIISKFRMEAAAKRRELTLAQIRTNKAISETFLATNKNNPGIITLPDGLQYRVLREGSGEPPKREDIVKLNYRGTLLDGREFENSTNFMGAKPKAFAVNALIPGWTEALMKMKPGAKWELFIPPNLAYQDFGNGQNIGPEETLHLVVELVSVEKPLESESMSSDIVKVPSLDQMQKGAKVETIKAGDVEKMEREYQEAQKKAQPTNPPAH